jgi:hypothetical protein
MARMHSGRLAGWCDAQLAFMRAIEIDPRPPLPYARREFDFAYALSALTHLPEEAVANGWPSSSGS